MARLVYGRRKVLFSTAPAGGQLLPAWWQPGTATGASPAGLPAPPPAGRGDGGGADTRSSGSQPAAAVPTSQVVVATTSSASTQASTLAERRERSTARAMRTAPGDGATPVVAPPAKPTPARAVDSASGPGTAAALACAAVRALASSRADA